MFVLYNLYIIYYILITEAGSKKLQMFIYSEPFCILQIVTADIQGILKLHSLVRISKESDIVKISDFFLASWYGTFHIIYLIIESK